MSKPRRFRFSVGDLLALSTIIALTCGIGAGLGLGFTPLEIRIFFLVYIFVGGAWAILRGPTVYGNLQDVRQRQRKLAATRTAIVEDVRRRKMGAKSPSERPESDESLP